MAKALLAAIGAGTIWLAPPLAADDATASDPQHVRTTDLGTAGAPAGAAVDINNFGRIAGHGSDPETGASWPVVWRDGQPSRLAPAGRVSQINNRNEVIGAVDDEDQSTHAVLWDGDAGTETIIRPEAVFSTAVDLNDRGEVLIWYTLASGGAESSVPTYHAALWRDGREVAVLPVEAPEGTPPGTRLRPVALNGRGEVAITAEDETGRPAGVFYWFDGRLTEIGSLGGGGTSAVAIDEHGWIAGTSRTATGQEHAFLWQDGTMVDLGTLGGDRSRTVPTRAAMSDAGHVIGISTTASGEERAFVWQNGTMVDLGTLGGRNVNPVAVNDRGEVVGNVLTGQGEQHAFYWDGSHGQPMLDLGTLGGNMSWAYGLNESGQIVGASRTPTGAHHATLWTVTP